MKPFDSIFHFQVTHFTFLMCLLWAKCFDRLRTHVMTRLEPTDICLILLARDRGVSSKDCFSCTNSQFHFIKNIALIFNTNHNLQQSEL